ncbi:FemAB family XrtA/PEP-CTERM system-associated protein [Sphingomonas sp. PAMC 26617]|uniref:FemAB family XrtA/PEP-CTERM system-associated protein n=1 Tax=Sphingomonas sp. PAMC 26617 TaxID=1112216 RepID=UPI000287F2F9|nr:FemAB family XrtA/PEP-CTERM system-associated protein [Sphingomonas sp. PAMC 26617]
MTLPLLATPVAIRVADLRNAQDHAGIDAFVRAHPQATPFHLPAWSIGVAQGCGQTSHTLIAERADGTLTGILPLTEVRSPLFGKALVSNGFAVGGGILTEEDAAVGPLADAAIALAARLGCPTLELRGGAVPAGEWSVDTTTYLGFSKPIPQGDTDLLAAIPRKQRAEVRKALDGDLTVTIGRGTEDRRAHYAVYAESVRNLGTPVFPARLFRSILEQFGADADILTVRSDGLAVSSVLSLYLNGTVYPYWGGGTQAARGLRANDRMYHALMAHARARGCTRFDFGRSKAGTGPAAFKKNWGFEGLALTYAKHAATGCEPREINPLDPRYARKVEMWKKLPLWLANIVGPQISRGLG